MSDQSDGNYGADPRLIQVILTRVRKGVTAQDMGRDEPIRDVTQIHDVEGSLLAEDDPWNLEMTPEKLMEVYQEAGDKVIEDLSMEDEQLTVEDLVQIIGEELERRLNNTLNTNDRG